MLKESKDRVDYDQSLAKLDRRVGRIVEVQVEARTHKPTYKMVVGFGRYGKRDSYGRFTQHPITAGTAGEKAIFAANHRKTKKAIEVWIR